MAEPRWHDEGDFGHWLRAQLEQAGWAEVRIGPAQRRPWSLVYPIEAGAGARYFAKASAPPLSHEAALTANLGRWAPGLGPAVRAVAGERSWLLMADAGRPLREQLGQEEYLPHWRRTLVRLAEAQRTLAERAAELLALGTPDRRLECLPGRLRALLENRAALRLGEAGGLREEEWRRLRARQPAFVEECARLAEYGIPASLHHDDFHDGNLLVDEAGAITVADWGESALAHPFFTLRVALRYLAYRLEWAVDAPQLRVLADAYLAVWGDPQRLRPALALAMRLASVNRALTWAQLAPLSAERDDQTAAAAWLCNYLAKES